MLKETLKVAMSAVAALADKVVDLAEAPIGLVLRRELTDSEKKAIRGVVIVGIAIVYVALGYLGA